VTKQQIALGVDDAGKHVVIYRSEFAYPKELWLLKPGLEFLSWTYGVPVRML